MDNSCVGNVMPELKKVSIVVVTHSNRDQAINCLNTVFSSTYSYPEKEVIVVDNASDYANVLQDLCIRHDFRYMRSDKNLSFDYANEMAIKESQGDYVILLNDDTLCSKSFWLEKFVAFAEEHPKAGVIGCRLVYPQDDTIQHCGVVFSQYRQPYHKLNHADVNDPRVLEAKQFQAVTFACVMIRKETYDQIKGFTHHSEEPAYWYEDIDFCFRAREAGWEIWYTPDVIVYHFSAQSYGKVFKDQKQCFQHLPKFIEQWFMKIDNDDWKELEIPAHNPHVAIGIPLTEGSGWRFEQLMEMVKGFHYWKANMTLILSISDCGPNFLKRVQDYCRLNMKNFKDLRITTKPANFADKMQSVYFNREEIRKAFLTTNAEYLFFIDSDVSMERTTLRELIDICEVQGADIASAPYFYKVEDRPRPMLFKKAVPTSEFRSKTLKKKNEIASDHFERNIGLGNFCFAKELMDGGIHEAGATGMGCTLIKRKCLEAIPFKPKELYGTEDLSWFAEASDKGFKLMVDTGAKIYHLDPNGYVYCWWQYPIKDRSNVWELSPVRREHENGVYYR